MLFDSYTTDQYYLGVCKVGGAYGGGTGVIPTNGIWYNMDLIWISNSLAKLYADGIQVSGDVTTNIPTVANLPVHIGATYTVASSSFYSQFDWILVRKITSNEPSFSTWGNQENYTYNSPMNMNDAVNTWTWSNFTWSNASVAEGTIVGWKIYYNDTSNNTNGTDINTFRIIDTTTQKWYDNNTNPSSPATYSSGQNYQFNITFNDSFGMSDVILEFNSQNYSYLLGQLSNSGQVYYKTITDLTANTSGYNYRWYGNDTSNNWNSTSNLVYVINKATPNLRTYIDNVTANKTVTYSVLTELRANSTTATLAPTFNFYRNNTLIGT